MGQPVPERIQECAGRRGNATFYVRWTASDADDLSNAEVISLADATDAFADPRFKVEKIEWSASSSVSADIEFDSMPMAPESRVFSIPTDVTAGEVNFRRSLSGGIRDPNRPSPGNVVITTRNAAVGDELTLYLEYMEQGVTLR